MNDRQLEGAGRVLLSLLADILVAGALAHDLLHLPRPVERYGGPAEGARASDENREQSRRLVIPPGSRLEQIATTLASEGLVDARRFLELAKHPRQEEMVGGATGDAHSLEGHLLPGSYEVPPRASAKALLQSIVARSKHQFNDAMRRRGLQRGLSPHEVLTLASLVQREAGFPSDMPAVAGVFKNRLRADMPLQSNPTVIYALDSAKSNGGQPTTYWERRLSKADFSYQSPYNSYLHKGLPPAPIANPSIEAIRAVLYPADVDYLYFVAKPNRALAYAKTLPQHKKNVRRYLRGRQGRQSQPHLSELQALIERVVAPVHGHVGIVVKNLATGETASLNGGDFFSAASLYKLFVLETAFQRIEDTRLAAGDRIAVSSALTKGTAEADSAELQARLGTRPTLAHALEEMIVVSNNAAAKTLLKMFGGSKVTAFARSEGFEDTWVTPQNSITTPQDVADQLEQIAEGRAVSKQASAEMRSILLRQEINDRLPRFLPKGMRIAHKTGTVKGLTHDAGVVYTRQGPVVIVAMTEGVRGEAAAKYSIVRHGQLVVDYFRTYKRAASRIAGEGNPACDQNPFWPRGRGPLSNQTIVLDPGHGGKDAGAIFPFSDRSLLKEKDAVLDIAGRLTNLLVNAGATVYMTRCRDVNPSLVVRAAFANHVKPDLFVSVHLNASEKPSKDGTEIFYLARDDHDLANYMLGSFTTPGLWQTLNERLPLFNLGVSQARFDVLVYGRAPGILTESLYLTHPREAAALRKRASGGVSRREAIARGHLRGIISYFRR
jgi:uncharacterized YceG family protein